LKVLLAGSEGNMGARYKAILDYLRIPFMKFDKSLPWTIEEASYGCDRAIVCTPTDTHDDVIREIIRVMPARPILCEKPVTKCVRELANLLSDCEDVGTDLRMVMQYKKLYKEDGLIGPTTYNYFKHGQDGIFWDCLQIIGLARGRVKLDETSPFWQCVINGQMLRIANMDLAYVQYVEDWLKSPQVCVGPDEMYEIHEKCLRMIQEHQ
jgi:hypothetical protein